MAKITTLVLDSSFDNAVVAMIKSISSTDSAVKLLSTDGNVITLTKDDMNKLCEVWGRKNIKL